MVDGRDADVGVAGRSEQFESVGKVRHGGQCERPEV
jgi:hypothetical protein